MMLSTAQRDPERLLSKTRAAPDHQPASWRLLPTDIATGAANMALDEAILAAVTEGSSPPTLRFYGWAPPCLSLGRTQPAADVDWVACQAMGADVVRRPTGGRAILHTDELTYCLVTLDSDLRVAGGVLEGYRRLSAGLLAGLALLGAEATQASPRQGAGPRSATDPSPVCFEAASDYEILAAGRKLIGSAQFRARGGVLQHGTLPLHGDLARILHLLALSSQPREEERRRLACHAITLEELLGRIVPLDEAADALAQGFASALTLNLVPGTVTDRERTLAANLQRTRYATREWTNRC